MHFKIAQSGVEINEGHTEYVNETLRMQLGRYTQIITSITVNFKDDKDQFGQDIVACDIEIEFINQEPMTASNTATTVEKALYNAVSRAKRQLDRQKRANSRQVAYPYISK
jgi:ribosome-associated translation inhibitor RaiA